MEQMWQICELEDSSELYSERFSVSAVPESWTKKLQDGTLVCYWPSSNAGSKIRSLKYPKKADKCAYYKCRILMNGEKFATYKEAKEAELIAQNRSVMESSSIQNDHIEKPCDGTMDFDVEDADNEKYDDDTAGYSSCGFNVTDAGEGGDIDLSDADTGEKNDKIEGNDSTLFNKMMLKEGHYYPKKKIIFEIETLYNSDEDALSNASDNSCYSATFGARDANFLTSTVDDNMDNVKNYKESELTELLLKISAIDFKVSSFVRDIRHDINELKVTVSQMKKHEMSQTVNRSVPVNMNLAVHTINSPFNAGFYDEMNQKENVLKESRTRMWNDQNSTYKGLVDDQYHLNAVPSRIQKLEIAAESPKEIPTENTFKAFFNETFVERPADIAVPGSGLLSNEIVERSADIAVPGSGLLFNEIVERSADIAIPDSGSLSNETFVQGSADVPVHGDVSNAGRAKVLNIEILHLPSPAARKVPSVEDDLIDEVLNAPSTVDQNHNVKPSNILELPLTSIDEFERNEDCIYDVTDFEKALMDHLAPLQNESEATYMNRTILTMFDESFFLKSVAWKKEKDRINMKSSKLLSCWKESYARVFTDKIDDKIIMSHFRRLKSAIRASTKAKVKRLATVRPSK